MSMEGTDLDQSKMVEFLEERLRERCIVPSPEVPDSPEEKSYICQSLSKGAPPSKDSVSVLEEISMVKEHPETVSAWNSETRPSSGRSYHAKVSDEDPELGLTALETSETNDSRLALYVALAVLVVCLGTALIVMEHERMAKVNPSLIASITAPMLAQLCKPFTHYFEHGVWSPSRALGSGGMPSGHAASVVSLATCSGMRAGWESNEFAIAATLMMIVMYDACHVRLESEHHAVILNEMAQHLSDEHSVRSLMRKQTRGTTGFLKTKIGHYKRELAGGSIVGVCAGLLVSTIK
eukprot:TRINITY_DN92666_c0_g1_i1.p1 TRINITY_DN92666_c0_g1~~TRINITY_DN92666_c0_g1_i1.p1  ORF type:complete len:294 (+),score=44.27 TRINITY_DN92666_c0_g1_i1:120-1001(+)